MIRARKRCFAADRTDPTTGFGSNPLAVILACVAMRSYCQDYQVAPLRPRKPQPASYFSSSSKRSMAVWSALEARASNALIGSSSSSGVGAGAFAAVAAFSG